ncbi:MAG TPA: thiamine pyrophosphate-dependent enzyme, partial [Bacillota bacterium]
QIDRAANHLGLTFPVDVGIAASIEDAAHELRRRLQPAARPAWSRLIEQLKTQWTQHLEGDHTGEQPARPAMAGPPAPGPLTPPWTPGDGWQPRVDRPESAPGLRPAAIIRALERRLGGDAVLCLGVGDNTFWVASLFRAQGQRVLISGHWRSMGFALPAAIAAKLAAPRVPVVAVCGDGGFAMTMAEFTTAVALDLPIVVIVLNNRALAEESHKQLRMQLQPFGVRLHNPDFAVFARACGGEGHRVDDEASLDRALAAALRARRPCLLDVHTQVRMPALAEPRGTLAPPAIPLATARGPF